MTADVTARELARLTGGRLVGPPGTIVRAIAPLERAGPHDLSFLAAKRYLPHFQRSRAAVVLCAASLADEPAGPTCRVVVPDPHAALATVIPVLYPARSWQPGVHPTAVVGRGAVWQDPVELGPYVVLGDGVTLGRSVRLGAGCVLGDGVIVGDEVRLFPQVVCYPGTVLGNRVILHAGVRLGSDGFGYVAAEPTSGSGDTAQSPRKIPQIGRCIIADDVEIGANTTIDRGSVDDTFIGAGTKIDNLVQIGHNVRIGARCFLAAQVGVAGSTHIGDDVLLGGQAGVPDHIEIGSGARILARAGLTGAVAPRATVSGYPARNHREYLRAQGALYRLARIVDRLEALADSRDGRDE